MLKMNHYIAEYNTLRVSM